MKFLLVLLVVVVGIWLWRSNRKADAARERPDKPPAKPKEPVEMVACAHCGVHCAREDAIAGRAGLYCCSEHRRLAEG